MGFLPYSAPKWCCRLGAALSVTLTWGVLMNLKAGGEGGGQARCPGEGECVSQVALSPFSPAAPSPPRVPVCPNTCVHRVIPRTVCTCEPTRAGHGIRAAPGEAVLLVLGPHLVYRGWARANRWEPLQHSRPGTHLGRPAAQPHSQGNTGSIRPLCCDDTAVSGGSFQSKQLSAVRALCVYPDQEAAEEGGHPHVGRFSLCFKRGLEDLSEAD